MDEEEYGDPIDDEDDGEFSKSSAEFEKRQTYLHEAKDQRIFQPH